MPGSFGYTFSPMKKTKTTQQPSAEQTVADLAHLSWCALMALHFAWQDGQALSPLSTHTFLMRWLAIARKQHRFPKSVAGDIDTLLALGRKKGPNAGLHSRFGERWHTGNKPTAEQSELHRLAYAIEKLKAQGWINAVVEDYEWHFDTLASEYQDGSALLVRKSDLQNHFSEQGRLLAPAYMLVIGDPGDVVEVLNSYELYVIAQQQRAGLNMIALQPAG